MMPGYSGHAPRRWVTGPRIARPIERRDASYLWQWAANHAPSEADEIADEPPRKRTKLSVEDEDTTHSHEPHLIPVAKHSFTLCDDESPNDSEEVRDVSLDVSLMSVQRIDDELVELRLLPGLARNKDGSISKTKTKTTSYGEVLVAVAQSWSQQEISDAQRVSQIECRARGTGKSAIAQSRCKLKSNLDGNTGGRTLTLEMTIFWPDGASGLTVHPSQWQPEKEIFTRYFGSKVLPPAPHKYALPHWSPQDFYSAVHAPPVTKPVSMLADQKVLDSDLYPFQKRALQWMLEREGVMDISSDEIKKEVQMAKDADELSLPFSYRKETDAHDQECFVSDSQSVICSRTSLHHLQEPKGGILAEEMGLGKTCELIALVCLNKRPSNNVIDGLRGTGATLIVTPLTILQQWKDEISRHAPHLSWIHYEGMGSLTKSKKTEDDMVEAFAENDIVLTTYPVLAKEVHFAVDPPERNLRRRQVAPARKRSPLVQMHWWRVCLDEAQMVESGVSAAATVAALVPRENAWAVSGTPFRKDIQDLRGLLIFLRYKPYSDSADDWKRLVSDREDFKHLFGRIALRHTKDKIRHELRLPPQRRVVITVPFTAIEEQNYRSLFTEMAYDCGCTVDGAPLHDQWNPEHHRSVERMRSWLLRLRQTCLHPQVGGRNRQALGRGAGPLRTVAEVLEVMIDQGETSIRTEARSCLMTQLLRAHIVANAKDDERRSEKALLIYHEAASQSETIVEAARRELHEVDSIVVDEAEGTEKTPEQSKRQRMQANLRNALEVQHACHFFVGTSYFQVKSNETLTKEGSDRFKELEEMEVLHYDKAKLIRKELLKEASSRTEALIHQLGQQEGPKRLHKVVSLADLQTEGGIENRRIMSRSDQLADIMTTQTKLIREWYKKIIELLSVSLVDKESEETTGEEYEDSTKQQDEVYCYFDAFRALVADRFTCLTGQVNLLVNHEMRMLYKDALEGNGHSPPLMIELLDKRKALLQKEDGLISVRGLIHETRSAETAVQWQEGRNARVEAELGMLRDLIKQLQEVASAQGKAMSLLEKDQELFRTTMNQRLEFYRQLQQISDTVAPYREELDDTLDQAALDAATKKGESQERQLATLKTKLRFLHHLRDESVEEGQRICVICQCAFEQGVLTVCGHTYCKECIGLWYRQHRTCPVCKKVLQKTDFHAITYKPQELQAKQEDTTIQTSSGDTTPNGAEAQSPSKKSSSEISIYSDISPAVLNDIKSTDLPPNSSYGTKIDTIARHLLYLRRTEPGTKSVIFSQYRDFLSVLSTALSAMSISHVQITQRESITRFQEDPSIEAFLLDAKTDSSGLNLVNATNVMLCEPLVNVAIELQAIARVHRIGQRRPTSVWMYLVKDTVEESIYELSVQKRLQHVQSSSSSTGTLPSRANTPGGIGTEAAVDKAESLQFQQAALSKLLVAGKGQGEQVQNEDLWSCLFGQASKSAASGKPVGFLDAEVGADVDAAGSGEIGRFLRAEAAMGRTHDL